MIAPEIRERFLRESLPIRLGSLAADLARLASWADNPDNSAAVTSLLEEAKYFAEWAADGAPWATQATLAEIQISVAWWQRRWVIGQTEPSFRARAEQWSNELLSLSGLIDA